MDFTTHLPIEPLWCLLPEAQLPGVRFFFYIESRCSLEKHRYLKVFNWRLHFKTDSPAAGFILIAGSNILNEASSEDWGWKSESDQVSKATAAAVEKCFHLEEKATGEPRFPAVPWAAPQWISIQSWDMFVEIVAGIKKCRQANGVFYNSPEEQFRSKHRDGVEVAVSPQLIKVSQQLLQGRVERFSV